MRWSIKVNRSREEQAKIKSPINPMSWKAKQEPTKKSKLIVRHTRHYLVRKQKSENRAIMEAGNQKSIIIIKVSSKYAYFTLF